MADRSTDKIRVLFFCSNPEGAEELDLDRDWDAIQHAVDIGQRHRDLLVKPMWQPCVDALFDELNVFKPEVLHFSGHAGRREGLFFTHPHGDPEPLSAASLVHLLRSLRDDGPDLVVLATCRSLALARAATRFVKCAVGVEAELDDDIAARFLRGFYGGLATGRSVAAAFEQGQGRAQSLSAAPWRQRFHLEFNARVDPGEIFIGAPPRRDGGAARSCEALEQGVRLLDLRLYTEAAACLREALRCGCSDANAHYYLVLAGLRGRRPARLASLDEARAIEAQLAAALQKDARAHHYYLWAWLKLDYYQRHGLLADAPPSIDDLLRQAGTLPADVKELGRILSALPPGAPSDLVTRVLRERCSY